MQLDAAQQPRKAALLLHALSDKARESVLQRLDAPQRQRVEPLLRELEALGFPREQDWLSLLARTPAGEQAPETVLQRLTGARAVETLGQQPVETIAAILAHRDWPWSEAFLAGLPVERRLRVRQHAEAGVRPAQRVIEQLLKAFAREACATR